MFKRGQSGTTNCLNCGAGYYCPPGSTEKFLCPPGHYCGAKVAVPEPCAAGTYNPTYEGSSTGDCQPCPAGYYCKLGTTIPTKCPAGRICGLNSQDYVATKCAPGKYSGAESIGATGDCRDCPKGHYCPSTDAVPSVFPIPCPQGTFRSSKGASLLSDCTACSDGRVCPYLGNQVGDAVSLPCLPGYPCPAGTKTFYEFQCPAGTYSDL